MANIKVHCKYDELKDPKKIIDHPKNRNKHGKDQIERLADIYKYQGIRHPIIVSRLSGFIVAGHGRKLAAIRAGVAEMPVVFQEFESAEQEYAFIQSDNAIALWADLDLSGINADLEFLGPDFDIDMLGIHNFTLDMAEKDFLADADEVPEHVEPKSKLGDIYQLGDHRLMCGDSTSIDDVEKLMDGNKADMVFTDPPYGGKVVGKAGGKESGFNRSINKIKREIDFISNFNPSELLQILKIIDAPSQYIFTNLNLLKEYLDENSKILVWHKKHGLPSVGNYNSDIEFIVFTKKNGTYFDNGNNALSYSRLISMVKIDRDLHPTMKPIALIENCLKISSQEKNIVLDLFGGSGSTLIACEKTNRKCFMMELDPHYVDVIVARWENFTGKKAEVLNV
jgi:DNA modification methylase